MGNNFYFREKYIPLKGLIRYIEQPLTTDISYHFGDNKNGGIQFPVISFCHENFEFLNQGTQYAERTLNKFKKILIKPLQDERAWIKGSQYVLFQILD